MTRALQLAKHLAMKTASRLSILNYSDYRSYLRDHFQSFKKRNARFSFNMWSHRLGLRGSSGLIMVLQGDRNPGPVLTESLVRDLQLTGREATFFRDLVALEKCKRKPAEQSHLLQRLAALHPRRTFRTIDSRVFQMISRWPHYVIRELVDLSGFKEDPVWIQKRLLFELTQSEIVNSLKNLEALGLLTRDAHGKLKYVSDIQTTFDVPDEGLKQFHEQFHDLSRRSLRETDPNDREISGITFTLRKEDLPRAKELVRQLIFDLGELGKVPGDEVYHAELSLFPLTHTRGVSVERNKK